MILYYPHESLGEVATEEDICIIVVASGKERGLEIDKGRTMGFYCGNPFVNLTRRPVKLW